MTVQIAYLHREDVSHSWVESMRNVRDYDLQCAVSDGADLKHCIEVGYRIARKPMNMRCGSAVVAQVRNYTARLFLDKTEHEWLMFIDTDMGFEPDAVHRLLAVADPVDRPVVGGLCFALMVSGHDGMGGWRRTIVPTMYKMGESSDGGPSFCYFGDYEDDTVTQVAATGGAFLLIHRSALEKVRAEHGDHWFDMLYDLAGDIVGEDIAFCARLLKAGIVPVVHTGVKTTHHKDFHLSEQDYEIQRAVTVRMDPQLSPHVDVAASLETLVTNAHVRDDGMLKLEDDLSRYQCIIDSTLPEVIVETGTHKGASARWFADLGIDVITIDIEPQGREESSYSYSPKTGAITYLSGRSSADPDVIARVANLTAGRRVMVSLDSDHSAEHVAAEIEAYAPMVSDGCYLVVEDGIFGLAPQKIRDKHFPAGLQGSPLDAIAALLHGNPEWSRDIAIEQMTPLSHHVAGFWVRNG